MLVCAAIFLFWTKSLMFLSCHPTGMGSGGSAGKEAGPFKALLRQQTQSALEQRVRQTHSMFISVFVSVSSRAVSRI